ncbi:MAG: hypothetical protein ACI9LM_003449 [Alteromonadaceae bacterium]|jgi:hypothetical protein
MLLNQLNSKTLALSTPALGFGLSYNAEGDSTNYTCLIQPEQLQVDLLDLVELLGEQTFLSDITAQLPQAIADALASVAFNEQGLSIGQLASASFAAVNVSYQKSADSKSWHLQFLDNDLQTQRMLLVLNYDSISLGNSLGNSLDNNLDNSLEDSQGTAQQNVQSKSQLTDIAFTGELRLFNIAVQLVALYNKTEGWQYQLKTLTGETLSLSQLLQDFVQLIQVPSEFSDFALGDFELADIALLLTPNQGAAQLQTRVTSNWQFDFVDKTFAVDDIQLAVQFNDKQLSGLSLAGQSIFFDVKANVLASYDRQAGWDIQLDYMPEQTVQSDQQSQLSQPLALSTLLTGFVEDIDLPMELPTLALSDFRVNLQPKIARLALKALSTFTLDLPGITTIELNTLINLERSPSAGTNITLNGVGQFDQSPLTVSAGYSQQNKWQLDIYCQQGGSVSLTSMANDFFAEVGLPIDLPDFRLFEPFLSLNPQTVTGSLSTKVQSNWPLEFEGTIITVEQIDLNLQFSNKKLTGALIKGFANLDGLKFDVLITHEIKKGWTIQLDTQPDQEVRLFSLLATFLDTIGLPAELPDYTLSDARLLLQPKTSTIDVTARTAIDLRLTEQLAVEVDLTVRYDKSASKAATVSVNGIGQFANNPLQMQVTSVNGQQWLLSASNDNGQQIKVGSMLQDLASEFGMDEDDFPTLLARLSFKTLLANYDLKSSDYAFSLSKCRLAV